MTALLEEVSAFLFLEARLADESRYEEWLGLWADEAHYWVPAGTAGEDYDRDRRISFINDNRNRLVTRIRQLQTGVRYAQSPPSPMRRVLGNIELLDVTGPAGADADGVEVGANFVLYELSAQASNDLRIWAGRSTHRLRRGTDRPGGWRIEAKVVELVNATRPLPNLAFLL
ncbi:MAG: aromatic-ring-hydroxylating dioxygenase subunit beta [Acidimicrobiales bacterium]